MMRSGRLARYAGTGLVAAVIAVTTVGVAPAQAASALPYTDKAATGFITLYNKSGQPIKSGSVHDKPFVAKAVASNKAPAPYTVTGAKASLAAYQPRTGVDPTQWSGDIITTAAVYTDPTHPTALGAANDFTLQDLLDEYPPRWDGLIELRIFLGAPNQSTLTSSYAATDLRIVGDNWVVVGGGPGAGDGGANIPGTVSPSLAAAAAGGASVGADATNGADSTNTADDGPLAAVLPLVKAPATLAIAAAVIVALVLGGVFWRRRRSQGGS